MGSPEQAQQRDHGVALGTPSRVLPEEDRRPGDVLWGETTALPRGGSHPDLDS